jgi:hypothetical protein|tara:strand:- start:993 stop:1583 length:591 start_codon:yes stop_codon:yes gene_type:complete
MSFLFGGNKGPTNIPEGRRERSKFRKAGEAVSYSPKIRDKDKREKLRRDLSDFDFTPRLPKYGKDLIPPDNREEGGRRPDPRINVKPRPRKKPLPRGFEGLIDLFPDPRINVRPRNPRGYLPYHRGSRPRGESDPRTILVRPRPERGRRRRRRREPDPRAINIRPRPKKGIAPTSDSPLFDAFPMGTPRFERTFKR